MKAQPHITRFYTADRSKFLMILCVWGMELSWLYASASFVMTSAFGHFFPLMTGVAASALAMMLTAFTRAFCRRPIQIIAIQLLGFTVVCLRLIHVHQNVADPFFTPHWLMDFLNHPKSLLQWLSISLSLLWLFFFYLGGLKIVRSPKDFFFVRNRFDLGVGIFVAVLLIELLIIVKAGIHIQGGITEMMMFPFFIFGMLAFTLIRSSGRGQRSFIIGYRGVGTSLSFAAVILLLGAGIVMFFLPQLTTAAQVGFNAIKTVSHPLGPVFVNMLFFIFRNRRNSLSTGEGGSERPEIPVMAAGKEGFFYHLLGWLIMSVFILVVTGLLLFIIWRLLRWLLAIQSHETPVTSRHSFLDLVRLLQRLLLSMGRRLAAWARGPQSALQLYKALVGWGSLSGLPSSAFETPLEYGVRLGARFPRLRDEIQRVIHTHSETVYGAHDIDDTQFILARSALRRLRSPANWLIRVRSLFRH